MKTIKEIIKKLRGDSYLDLKLDLHSKRLTNELNAKAKILIEKIDGLEKETIIGNDAVKQRIGQEFSDFIFTSSSWNTSNSNSNRTEQDIIALSKERFTSTNVVMQSASDFWQSESDQVKRMSHFRGSKTWDNNRWFKWGIFYESCLVYFFSKYNDSFLTSIHRKKALEWGVGGGVNLRILANLFDSVYGVDISKDNLLESNKQLKKFKCLNFTPIYINLEEEEEIAEKLQERLDFILCAAVFQHMPSKEYVSDVLNQMHGILDSGGYALFQTRHNNGSNESKHDDYDANFLSFTTFESDEFLKLLELNGYEVLESSMGEEFNFISSGMKSILRKANYEFFFVRKA